MKMKLLYSCIALCLVAVIYMSATQPAYAVCANPSGNDGAIVYNSANKVFQYCKGTAWSPMNIQPGSGSGGCTNPALAEGQLAFNTDYRVLQGCAGNVNRPMGPVGGQAKWSKLALGFASDQGCAIREGGTAWCWGDDGSLELGNGAVLTADQHSPTEVSTTGVSGTAWIWLDMEISHACGVRNDGTGYCWGSDSSGKLGNGSVDTSSKSTPISMTMTGVTGSAWISLVTGQDNTCGIRNDGTGYCWGDDANGQVGNGAASTGFAHVPMPVSLTGVTGTAWTFMTGGWRHHCGIRNDGTGYCWGNDTDGKLGNGATGSGTAPSPINVAAVTGTAWTSLSAAQNHSCGIRDNGTGWCWGNDTNGELGNGAGLTADQTAPSAIDLTGVSGSAWISLEAGTAHSCGVRNDGTGYCWGDDSDGELGNDSATGLQVSPYPVTTTGLSGSGWVRIVASGSHSCGIRNDGTISCWGNDGAGRLANGPEGGDETSAVNVVGGMVWKALEAGSDHSCGIKSDDTAWCWGDDTTGELGNGAPSDDQNVPVAVTGGHLWKKIDSGTGHTCGIKSDDTAWCWGNDSNGQLGDGVTTTGSPDPVLVSGGSTWKMIDTGSGITCGIKSDDSLWCWGGDASGQLGNGATTGNQIDPNLVTGSYSWKSVSTGTNHTCGIQADNTLWCWGSDSSGQLGNGATTGNQADPVYIMANIAVVAVSSAHTCAIDRTSDLWCWGAASNGRLGNGTTTPNQVSPVLITGGPWSALHAGLNSHTCATKADGSLWCWGLNSTGQLGDGTLTARSSPTQVIGGGTWLAVSVGSTHSCGLAGGGAMPAKAACWGTATNGELGHGKFSYTIAPKTIYCSGPEGHPGEIVYNTAESLLQYCDGVAWVGFNGGISGPPAPEGIPTLGLIGYWAFNESTGTTASDGSGNNNNGTLVNMNNADWVTGRSGNAIDFDGVDDYITVPHSSSLVQPSSFSIASWVRPATLPGAMAYLTMLVKNTPTNPNYWFEVRGDEFLGGFMNAGFREHFSGAATATINTWYHVAVVFDDAANRFKIYINGALVTNDVENTSPADIGSGALIIGAQGPGNQNMAVTMDELRIYNRALTDAEVQALAGQ